MDSEDDKKMRAIKKGKADRVNPFFKCMSLLRFKVSSPIGVMDIITGPPKIQFFSGAIGMGKEGRFYFTEMTAGELSRPWTLMAVSA